MPGCYNKKHKKTLKLNNLPEVKLPSNPSSRQIKTPMTSEKEQEDRKQKI